ncbi:MAG: hypothetical protein VX294_00925 [Candidatus Latescibacterota bacterium]|nr:hypothetical protein [Candidatus Latescibacterota bacterium]
MQNRLAQLRERLVCRTIIESFLFFIAVILWLSTVVIILEAIFYFSPLLRLMLLVLASSFSIFLVARRMINHLRPLLNVHRFVLSVESKYPELKQRLVTAIELNSKSDLYSFYSSSLVNATVDDAEKYISSINSRDLFRHISIVVALRYVVLSLVAPFCLLIWSNDAIVNSLHRCLNPSSNFFRPPETYIAVNIEKTEILRGEDLSITALFSGRLPRLASLMVSEDGSKPSMVKEFALQGIDSLHYTFSNIQHSFTLQIIGGDGASIKHRITVMDRPVLENINLHLKYPDYASIPDRWIRGGGDVEALIGTELLFEFEADRELIETYFVIDDTLKYPARTKGYRAYINWTLNRDVVYRVDIMDVDGLKNKAPINYRLLAKEDEFPAVSMVYPGQDEELPDGSKLELIIEANDDFGVEELFIVFDVNGSQQNRMKISINPGQNVLVNYLWDLSNTVLMPGDKINYNAEALDNDGRVGSKIGRSKGYVLSVPSTEERYEKRDRLIKDRLKEIEDISSENIGLEEYFEDVRREVLRTEELTWERKHELDLVLKTQEGNVGKINELSGKLVENIESINEEDPYGNKIAQKVKEIRQLMEDVVSPDLREALSKLRNKIEDSEAEDLAESLKRFIEDQIKFQSQLDRTIELLKQVKAEQQLNSLVRRSLEISKTQKKINEKVDRKELGMAEQKQQGFLRHELQSVGESIELLANQMESINRETSSQLKSQSGQLEKNDFGSRMLEMVKEMRSESSQVRKIGKGLEEDIGKFASAMESIRGEFIADLKDNVSRDLHTTIQDLLLLSHRQEELFRGFPIVEDLAMVASSEEQIALFKSMEVIVDNLAEIGRRTMSLEFGLKTSLGYAIKGVKEAASYFGQRDLEQAKNSQWDALVYMNETIVMLRQSLSNLESASMPSSFGEAMQKMLGLSEQQAQINQAGSRIFEKMGLQGSGRATQDLESQIHRLASEQERIRRALEQLQRSLRGRPGGQDKIQAIREEVQNVVDDLQQGRFNQRTLKRQDQIFQRMLEVGSSLHTRGFKKQREAQEGEDMAYLGPPGLPEDLGQAADLLRESMRRALESGYPVEYRELIRRYYETIYQDAVKELEDSR